MASWSILVPPFFDDVQELRWCLLGTVILFLVLVCLFFVSRTVAQLQGYC